MELASGIYIDQNPPVKEAGELSVSGNKLVFKNANRREEMPLEGLQINLGGSGHRVLYIKHSSQPHITLHSTDKVLLEQLSKSGHITARTVHKEYRLHVRRLTLSISVITSVLLSIAYGLFFEREWISGHLAQKVPYSLEAQWGQLIFSGLEYPMELIDDQNIQSAIENFAKPLLETSKKHIPHKITLRVSDSKEINAFALPGGYIVINRGLIEKASSPEEVLGVLAHELAHVSERHSLEQMLNQLGTYLFISVVFGDLEGVGAAIVENGKQLTDLNYSREHEEEADRLAVGYLTQSGINPNGIFSFFEKLKKEEGSLKVPELISTHPLTENRIVAIQTQISNLSAKTQNNDNGQRIIYFNQLRDMLKKRQSKMEKP